MPRKTRAHLASIAFLLLILSGFSNAQQGTPLVGNSSDGTHQGKDHLDKVANETIKSILENPDYSEAQKQRLIQAITSANKQKEVSETLESSGVEIDYKNETPVGYILIRGRFRTTEISNCWTDDSLVQVNVRIYEKRVGNRQMLVGITQGDPSHTGLITHTTGPRCGISDQGPMVTDADSVHAYVLGYYSPQSKEYTFMLEGSDTTHWTLKSGGEIGTSSFLKFYLPFMKSQTSGNLSVFTVSREQVKASQTLLFEGAVTGSGSSTTGVVGVMLDFQPTGHTEEVALQERFFAELEKKWTTALQK